MDDTAKSPAEIPISSTMAKAHSAGSGGYCWCVKEDLTETCVTDCRDSQVRDTRSGYLHRIALGKLKR